MAGRSKLTDEVWARIQRSVEVGTYAKVAAVAAGISEATYHRWRSQGRQDREQGRRTRVARFDADIEAAEARAEEHHIRQITQAAAGARGRPGDWKAAAWLLERKYPERYARRTNQEVSGPGGSPVQVEAGQGISSILAAAEQLAEDEDQE